MQPRLPMQQTSHVVQILGVLERFTALSCSVAPCRPTDWWTAVRPPNGSVAAYFQFEGLHGRSEARERYNDQHIGRVKRTRRTCIGTEGGLRDFFVPIVHAGRCDAVLIAGPFFAARPNIDTIRLQWAGLSAAQTSPYDPNLIAYARAMLGLQVLEAGEIGAMRELLEILARAWSGEGDIPIDADRVAKLRETVFARLPAALQTRAALMLDPMTNATWRTGEPAPWDRSELGLERLPNAAVALMPASGDHEGGDPVSSLVSGRAFQYQCARLYHKLDGALSAPVDEYGACLLFHSARQRTAAHTKLSMVDRARAIAESVERALGMKLTLGVGSLAAHFSEMPECARHSVMALQLAAQQGARTLVYEDAFAQRAPSLATSSPTLLCSRMSRLFATGMIGEAHPLVSDYLRAVVWDSGGHMGRTRLHLEIALDAVLDAAIGHADVDAKTRTEVRQQLGDLLSQTNSSQDLMQAFRSALAFVARIAKAPRQSSTELRVARAGRFIEEHCHEPLTLPAVARHVGLSTNYFSARFTTSYGLGFSKYLRRARVDRAKHLLLHSSVPVTRLVDQCGFVSVPHFHRVFKAATGLTPLQFRARSGARGRRAPGSRSRGSR